MEYRLLEHESPEKIHQCFINAFSDYIVPMQMPFEKFQIIMERNGVDLKFSLGLYDKDELVGFILNGTGLWNNKPTVYDSGTGIIKEYRGKKYSKKMFQILKQQLEDRFSQYLLEVIQTNTPAYTLYLNEGFRIERELSCFKGRKDDLDNLKIGTRKDVSIELGEFPLDWNLLKSMWNFPPSWQNSIQAVKRATHLFKTVNCFRNKGCVGYAVFSRQSGEIVHLAVKREMRKKGIGSMLLSKIAETIESPYLRIVNVDMRDSETITFLTNRFSNDVNQYEMILDLKEQ